MTKTEWRIVKILMVLVFIAALLPASAFVYRLFFDQELTLEDIAQLVAPAESTATPSEQVVPTQPTAVTTVANANPGTVNFVEYSVSDQGFAISIPDSWQRLPMNPRDLQILLDGIRAQNPEVANALGANAQNLIQSGIRFWAFDANPPALNANLMTTVTVLKRSLPGPTSLDTYVQVNVNQLSALKTRVGAISQDAVTLNNLPAVKLRYTLSFTRADGSTTLSAITQFLLVKDSDAYVIGFSTTPEQNDRYTPLFEKSASSFRILQ